MQVEQTSNVGLATRLYRLFERVFERYWASDARKNLPQSAYRGLKSLILVTAVLALVLQIFQRPLIVHAGSIPSDLKQRGYTPNLVRQIFVAQITSIQDALTHEPASAANNETMQHATPELPLSKEVRASLSDKQITQDLALRIPGGTFDLADSLSAVFDFFGIPYGVPVMIDIVRHGEAEKNAGATPGTVTHSVRVQVGERTEYFPFVLTGNPKFLESVLHDASVFVLKSVVKGEEHHVGLDIVSAYLRLESGEYETSISEFAALREQHKASPSTTTAVHVTLGHAKALYLQAKAERGDRDCDTNFARYERAHELLSRNPTQANAIRTNLLKFQFFYYFGNTHYRLGRCHAELADNTQPEQSADRHRQLARWHYNQALLRLENARSHDDRYWGVYYMSGFSHFRMGEFESSAAAFRKAALLKQDRPKLYLYWAKALHRGKCVDHPEAPECIAEYVAEIRQHGKDRAQLMSQNQHIATELEQALAALSDRRALSPAPR